MTLYRDASLAKAAARHTDPASSHEAADSLSSTHLEQLERRIVEKLKESGLAGLTVPELAAVLDYPRDSVSPRMKNIEAKGLVKRAEMRRKFQGGRVGCLVWIAV